MIQIAIAGDIWRFRPEPDITTYELAQVIPFLVPDVLADFVKLFRELPANVKRHFSLVK